MNRRTAPMEGFSLIEVLASVLVLSMVAASVTAVWKLADDKAFAARLENRATRLLREYYEQQVYASDEDRPFSSAKSSVSGFLYHPLLKNGSSGGKAYTDTVPYNVTLSGSTMTMTYQVPAIGVSPSHQVSRTIRLPAMNE